METVRKNMEQLSPKQADFYINTKKGCLMEKVTCGSNYAQQ